MNETSTHEPDNQLDETLLELTEGELDEVTGGYAAGDVDN